MVNSILCLPMGNKGVASSRTRVYDVSNELKRQKSTLKMKVCSGLSWQFRLLQFKLFAGGYPALFIQKDINEKTFQFVKKMKEKGKIIVYDMDDPVWTDFEIADEYLKIADHVFVENELCANHTKEVNPNAKIHVGLGPIDSGFYLQTAEINLKKVQKREDEQIILGWIGSPPTSKNINRIKEGLELAGKQNPNRIKLILMGASKKRVNHEFENIELEYMDWSLVGEKEFFSLIDIGLMPVKNDLENQGKGGYKILQYMACALPWIASDVGVNSHLSQNSTNGLLVESNNSAEDWAKQITTLINSPELRNKMAQNSFKFVQRYSLKNHSKWFSKIIKEI